MECVLKNNGPIVITISTEAKSDSFYTGLFETLKQTYQTEVAVVTL